MQALDNEIWFPNCQSRMLDRTTSVYIFYHDFMVSLLDWHSSWPKT